MWECTTVATQLATGRLEVAVQTFEHGHELNQRRLLGVTEVVAQGLLHYQVSLLHTTME